MLEGTLQDFPLPDILQLIGTQRKTGTLIISSDNNVATMSFRDGRVVYAKLESHPERIGDILFRLGKITGDQLGKALQRCKEDSGKKVGRALVELDFVTQEDLRRAIQRQIEDAAFRIFLWKQGRFKFDTRLVMEDQEAPVDLPVDSLIMESVRRVDEHNREQPPGESEAVYVIMSGGSERAAKMDLSVDDYGVLANLDGRKSLCEVSDKLRMSEIELARILARLCEAGIAAPVAPAEGPARSAPPAGEPFPDFPDLVAPESSVPPPVPPPGKEPARKISFL